MARIAVLSFVVLFLPIAAISQQAANATLSGTITDQLGAVIAGAQVTATHKATGVKRETVSKQDGFYMLSNMTPGEYEVLFNATGFAAKTTKSVSLKVGQTFTLNPQLDVPTYGAVVDDITYSAPLVDSSTTVIDGVI